MAMTSTLKINNIYTFSFFLPTIINSVIIFTWAKVAFISRHNNLSNYFTENGPFGGVLVEKVKGQLIFMVFPHLKNVKIHRLK